MVVVIIKLFDLVIQEYLAIMDRLLGKVPVENDRIILDGKTFYAFLDKNLYISRTDKLKIYRQLNLIDCNSNSFTAVIYDKETKKTKRKIILNIATYKILKALFDTEIKN